MATTRKCFKCGERPASVPDRDKPWSDRPALCFECHADRLRSDLAYASMVPSKFLKEGKHRSATNLRQLDENARK